MRNKLCKCCGTAFSTESRGRTYAPGHEAPGQKREELRSVHRNKAQTEVDAVEFAQALRTLKELKGWTWRQLADQSGRALGTICSYAHGQRTWVSKSVAEDILQRLNGASLPPTARQQVEYTAKTLKDQANQRAETLRDRKLRERKAKIAELKGQLGSLRLD